MAFSLTRWYVSCLCYVSPLMSLQGLGKTLQTISSLKHNLDIACSHLIVVPKSTFQNWVREFKQRTPDVNIVVLTCTKEERTDIIANRLSPQDFEICIASYEIYLSVFPLRMACNSRLEYHKGYTNSNCCCIWHHRCASQSLNNVLPQWNCIFWGKLLHVPIVCAVVRNTF
jgi:hypothetical protein